MNNLDKQRKWTYIIKRNGMVYELLLGEESYKGLFEAWRTKSPITVLDLNGEPIGVNAVDIVDILPENQYANYIETLAPTKNYILKGIWYDKKENRTVRVEPWKQTELDKTKPEEVEESETIDFSSLQKTIKDIGNKMRAGGVI